MRNLKNGAIDETLSMLEKVIEQKRVHMHSSHIQTGYSPLASYMQSEILNRAGKYYEKMKDTLETAKVLSQEYLNKFTENLQEDPWGCLRKVAVYSFAIGLFLSFRHRGSTEPKK